MRSTRRLVDLLRAAACVVEGDSANMAHEVRSGFAAAAAMPQAHHLARIRRDDRASFATTTLARSEAAAGGAQDEEEDLQAALLDAALAHVVSTSATPCLFLVGTSIAAEPA